MYIDPNQLNEAGHARMAGFICEAQGYTRELPSNGGPGWLRWLWRRIQVARRALATDVSMPAGGVGAARPRTLSITIEIKY
jgi:hypothetical protein